MNGFRNPNPEVRNPKEIRISKPEDFTADFADNADKTSVKSAPSTVQLVRASFSRCGSEYASLGFRASDLFRVSGFGLRISVLSLFFVHFLCYVHAAPLPKILITPDGHSFQTSEGKPFTPFGVTYYRPGTGWAPQVWKKFDADATRKDFARMKDLGVNCARVFISYGSFYNEPGVLDTNGLAKFDEFLAIAEKQGIYIHPTGPDHWEGTPRWAASDRIADEKVLTALEQFWTLFAARYRDRAVIFAYDLRNEPEVSWYNAVMRRRWDEWVAHKYGTAERAAAAWHTNNISLEHLPTPTPLDSPQDPLLLDYQHFREDVADEWTRRQVHAIKAADPHALVTVGLIQWSVPSLLPRVSHYSGFNPARQARLLDFLEIHFYPLDSGALEYRTDDEIQRNLSYLDTVVGAVATPGKPVVVAEFGWYGGGKPKFDKGRHPFATEDQQANWCSNLVVRTSSLACGWLNWGFYDQPEASDCSEFTGLMTSDAKLKTWGKVFQDLARHGFAEMTPALRRGFFRFHQTTPRPQIDWDLCLTSAKAANDFRARYYEWYKTQLQSTKP